MPIQKLRPPAVVRKLLGHEDIKTSMIYAKADTRLLRDAIKSLETLGNNSYVLVTQGDGEPEKILEGKAGDQKLLLDADLSVPEGGLEPPRPCGH